MDRNCRFWGIVVLLFLILNSTQITAEDESDIKFILPFVIEASETVVATPTSKTFPYTMIKSMLSEDDKVPDDGKKVIVEPDTEKAVFGA